MSKIRHIEFDLGPRVYTCSIIDESEWTIDDWMNLLASAASQAIHHGVDVSAVIEGLAPDDAPEPPSVFAASIRTAAAALRQIEHQVHPGEFTMVDDMLSGWLDDGPRQLDAKELAWYDVRREKLYDGLAENRGNMINGAQDGLDFIKDVMLRGYRGYFEFADGDLLDEMLELSRNSLETDSPTVMIVGGRSGVFRVREDLLRRVLQDSADDEFPPNWAFKIDGDPSEVPVHPAFVDSGCAPDCCTQGPHLKPDGCIPF